MLLPMPLLGCLQSLNTWTADVAGFESTCPRMEKPSSGILSCGKIVSDDEETLTSFVMFTLRSVIQGYDCRAIPHMYLGVSINGGTPIAGWLIRENPIYKLMTTRGTPISGHLHLDLRFFEVSW